MKKYKVLLWVGGIVFLIPFFGLRQSVKNSLLFIAGAIVIGVALTIRYQLRSAHHESSERVFVENTITTPHTPEPEITETEPSYMSVPVTEEPMTEFFDTPEPVVVADDVESIIETVDEIPVAMEEYVAEPVKKVRKKRAPKKTTIQAEMEEPMVMSEDVAQIMSDIDETLDANRQ